MDSKEAVKSRVVHREAAPDPVDEGMSKERKGGKEVSDDGSAPEAHLSPRKHIADKCGKDREEEEEDAEEPSPVSRRGIGGVVECAEEVKVDKDEKEGGAIEVSIA